MRFSPLPILLLASIPFSFGLFSNVKAPIAVFTGTNKVSLFRVTPFEARPGDIITLDGSGFSRIANKVHFDGGNSLTAPSRDGATITTNVPEHLPEGEYKLSVSNTLGSSDNANILISLKVTNTPSPPPSIRSASIQDKVVTLTGDGFTGQNNIITTLGSSSTSISANGDTLTFHLSDLSYYEKIRKSLLGRSYKAELWIYVQNEHGVNKNPFKLDITI